MTGCPVSVKTYCAVFGLLLVLTAITVGVAYVDLGVANTVVAVAIATIKAVLVGLYFMHLRDGRYLTWVFALAGILGFLILVVLTFGDYDTRDWLPIGGPR